MIVGLLANEGAGKSTLAQHLAHAHGFRRVHTMAPVNELIRELFGFTDEQLSGASRSRNEPHPTIPGLTARKAQKDIGMAIRKLYAGALIERALEPGPSIFVCIENVRFPDEVAAIKRRGGRIIRLRGGTVSDHPTETEQLSIPDSECDAVLPWYDDKCKRFELVDALIYCWSDL